MKQDGHHEGNGGRCALRDRKGDARNRRAGIHDHVSDDVASNRQEHGRYPDEGRRGECAR